MENDLDTPGKRLKSVRETLGLSQNGFCDILGIASQQSLSKYERGVQEIPDKVKLQLRQFGVSLDWFLTGYEPMFLPGWDRDGFHNEHQEAEIPEIPAPFLSPEDEIIELARKISSLARDLKTKISEKDVETFLAKYTKLSPDRQAKVVNYIEILLDQQGSEDSVPEAGQQTG